MKVPGMAGSFHLRTIKDPKTGRIKGKYWYYYVYDPVTKKMKSKRRDPPLGEVSPKVDNELTMPSGTPQLDVEILKDLIPVFARAGLKVPLEPEKVERIRTLAKEVMG